MIGDYNFMLYAVSQQSGDNATVNSMIPSLFHHGYLYDTIPLTLAHSFPLESDETVLGSRTPINIKDMEMNLAETERHLDVTSKLGKKEEDACHAHLKNVTNADKTSIDLVQRKVRGKQACLTIVPCYMMLYRYNKKSYHACLNAISEEVEGTRPYSAIKIALAALGTAAAGAATYIANNPDLTNAGVGTS